MLEDKRALVVGMKKSGLAAARLLREKGASVRATDLRPLEDLPEARHFLAVAAIPFTQQSPAVFEGVDLIVVSPDVPADLSELEAARRRGVLVIGEVELAAPYLKGRTIGVTGSNGKTTTTSLIGHILREAGVAAQVGGNIGTPVCDMVGPSRDDGWNVLELSSFQLETIASFRAHIGVALNVTQNHLDRHHTFVRYAAAKARLFETQQPGDFAVLNADDPVCRDYAEVTPAVAQWFSSRRNVKPGASLCGGQLIVLKRPLMKAAEVPIRGRHNVENVLAASLAAFRAGVGLEAIAAAVRTFRAVEHRLEFVRQLSGIEFYNDSKATSVDATLKAVEAFEAGAGGIEGAGGQGPGAGGIEEGARGQGPGAGGQRLWVILGGKDKGLDYSLLREPLRAKARAALLIGAAAGKIAAALDGAVPLVDVGTLQAAIEHAYRNGAPGDTVLLAPACASFDQFRSYEHRGEVFKELVNQLEAKE
jgi:UDP-N-acetylmuramoylalanine--D-glutamate ligase